MAYVGKAYLLSDSFKCVKDEINDFYNSVENDDYGFFFKGLAHISFYNTHTTVKSETIFIPFDSDVKKVT